MPAVAWMAKSPPRMTPVVTRAASFPLMPNNGLMQRKLALARQRRRKKTAHDARSARACVGRFRSALHEVDKLEVRALAELAAHALAQGGIAPQRLAAVAGTQAEANQLALDLQVEGIQLGEPSHRR